MQKRRQYFIERTFQTKFILKFCSIVIIASCIIGLLLFLLTKGSTTVVVENTKVVVKNTADFLLPTILTTVILVTIFSAISVAILSLFISHKIVGPLYRLKREITKVGGADLNANFRIRTGDQLQGLAESLISMVLSLKEKIKSLKEKFNQILPQLKKTALDKGEVEQIKEILDSFKV
ncbi:MAG: hypothetical protein ISS45_09720 [Candidatus Omnitrophica bacterium]|nr:hypothetical protein [Candidatus Omnitrophota bacterium]